MAIFVERLDRGQMRLMAEALPERQSTLRRDRIVLPQVRDRCGQPVIQR
jgi:hypothetical protein